jgi:hypothetical protein
MTLGGFQQRPGEDPHAEEVHAGFLHELQVLQPDAGRPLFRVVVSAEGDALNLVPNARWAGGFLLCHATPMSDSGRELDLTSDLWKTLAQIPDCRYCIVSEAV